MMICVCSPLLRLPVLIPPSEVLRWPANTGFGRAFSNNAEPDDMSGASAFAFLACFASRYSLAEREIGRAGSGSRRRMLVSEP